MVNNVKVWHCGMCQKKVLGKIHSGNLLIIQYKGLHLELTGNYSLEVICPLCGGKNVFNNNKINLKEYNYA